MLAVAFVQHHQLPEDPPPPNDPPPPPKPPPPPPNPPPPQPPPRPMPLPRMIHGNAPRPLRLRPKMRPNIEKMMKAMKIRMAGLNCGC
jgi:hypothetical protein